MLYRTCYQNLTSSVVKSSTTRRCEERERRKHEKISLELEMAQSLLSFSFRSRLVRNNGADYTQPQGRLPSADYDFPRPSTGGPPWCCSRPPCTMRRFPAYRTLVMLQGTGAT